MRIISATPILLVRGVLHAPAKFLAGDIAFFLTMLVALVLGAMTYAVILGIAVFADYVFVGHHPPGQFLHQTIQSLLVQMGADKAPPLLRLSPDPQATVLSFLLMFPVVPFILAFYVGLLLLALFCVKQVLEDRLLFLLLVFLIMLVELALTLNNTPSAFSNIPGAYVGAAIRDVIILLFLMLQTVAVLLLRLSPDYRASLRWPRFRFWTFAARYGFLTGPSWRKLAIRSLVVFGKVSLRLFGLMLVFALIEFVAGAIMGARWGGVSPALFSGIGLMLFVSMMMLLVVAASYELWYRKGFRFYNAVFLIFALSFTAIAMSSAYDVFYRGRAAESVFVGLGFTWKLFALFTFRGWILSPLVREFDRLRAELAVTAGELTRRIQAPPVLFLRSFRNDDAWTLSSFRIISWMFGRREFRVSIEQVVAEAVFPYGPLIALADPSNNLPAIGAALEAVPGETDWRQVVLDHVDQAALIVVCVGSTRSLHWEIETLIARDVLKRTVFVFPPGYPGLKLLLESHPRLVGLVDAAPAQIQASGIRALSWSRRENRFVAIRARRSTQSAYAETIRIAAGVEVGGPPRKGPVPTPALLR